MKQTKIDLSDERRIIANVIMNTELLRRVFSLLHVDLFGGRVSKIVIRWIIDYYDHTGEAPQRDVKEIYLQRKHELKDEDFLNDLSDFLSRLSDDWESLKIKNITYAEKQVVTFLKLQSLKKLKNNIENAVESKRPELGEQECVHQ